MSLLYGAKDSEGVWKCAHPYEIPSKRCVKDTTNEYPEIKGFANVGICYSDPTCRPLHSAAEEDKKLIYDGIEKIKSLLDHSKQLTDKGLRDMLVDLEIRASSALQSEEPQSALDVFFDVVQQIGEGLYDNQAEAEPVPVPTTEHVYEEATRGSAILFEEVGEDHPEYRKISHFLAARLEGRSVPYPLKWGAYIGADPFSLGLVGLFTAYIAKILGDKAGKTAENIINNILNSPFAIYSLLAIVFVHIVLILSITIPYHMNGRRKAEMEAENERLRIENERRHLENQSNLLLLMRNGVPVANDNAVPVSVLALPAAENSTQQQQPASPVAAQDQQLQNVRSDLDSVLAFVRYLRDQGNGDNVTQNARAGIILFERQTIEGQDNLTVIYKKADQEASVNVDGVLRRVALYNENDFEVWKFV